MTQTDPCGMFIKANLDPTGSPTPAKRCTAEAMTCPGSQFVYTHTYIHHETRQPWPLAALGPPLQRAVSSIADTHASYIRAKASHCRSPSGDGPAGFGLGGCLRVDQSPMAAVARQEPLRGGFAGQGGRSGIGQRRRWRRQRRNSSEGVHLG